MTDKLNTDIWRRSGPWEHLRQYRFTADSYLNRLILSDYRELFRRFVLAVSDEVLNPDLGRKFFTDDVLVEIQRWSEKELFSNAVRVTLCNPVKNDVIQTAG